MDNNQEQDVLISLAGLRESIGRAIKNGLDEYREVEIGETEYTKGIHVGFIRAYSEIRQVFYAHFNRDIIPDEDTPLAAKTNWDWLHNDDKNPSDAAAKSAPDDISSLKQQMREWIDGVIKDCHIQLNDKDSTLGLTAIPYINKGWIDALNSLSHEFLNDRAETKLDIKSDLNGVWVNDSNRCLGRFNRHGYQVFEGSGHPSVQDIGSIAGDWTDFKRFMYQNHQVAEKMLEAYRPSWLAPF